jgi:hypothetical protein
MKKLLLALPLLASCAGGPGAPAVPAHGPLTGAVLAPAGIVAQGGGNIIGGNASAYRGLLQAKAIEQPLAGVTVYAADAQGQPVPGIASAQTDAAGRYTLDLPAGATYVIAARTASVAGKPAVLQALGVAGGQADVSAASTCVSLLALAGKRGFPGELHQEAYQAAMAETRAGLSVAAWPDLGDHVAVVAVMDDLAARRPGLRRALDVLEQGLGYR